MTELQILYCVFKPFLNNDLGLHEKRYRKVEVSQIQVEDFKTNTSRSLQ